MKKIIGAFTLFLLIILGALYWRFSSFFNKISIKKTSVAVVHSKPQTTYTIALLGYGGGTHSGAYLTDTILLATINTATKRVLLTSIPRDIWVTSMKINSVYQTELFPEDFPALDTQLTKQKGEGARLKKILYDITGLTVDAFLAASFEAFKQTIDTLGGIDIYIEQAFEDREYPVEGREAHLCGKTSEEAELVIKEATAGANILFPCRYETIKFDTGLIHLDGETALKFVRSRHSETQGGDFNRAIRQQKVLNTVKERALSLGSLPKMFTLLETLQNHIRTDISGSLIQKAIRESITAGEYTVTQLIVSTDNYVKESYSKDGQYILVPKSKNGWQKLKKDIQKLLKGESIAPTIQLSPAIRPTKAK